MAFDDLQKWWDNRRQGCKEWRDRLRKIRDAPNLHGIEKPVGVALFVLNTLAPTELIRLFVWNWNEKRKSFPDLYVVAVTVLLGFLLRWSPSWPVLSRWIAGYLLASVIVYLLHVVLLTKVFGPVRSVARSLILLIFNVTQVVLIFAIFYRSMGIDDALVDAVLVFGTVSLPDEVARKARSVAAIQVATDIMLLAVFLGHFIGGLGRGEEERPRAEDLFAWGSSATKNKLTMKNWAGAALALSLFAVPIVASVIIANVTDTEEARGVYVLLVGILWAVIAISLLDRD
jgi:hypothetical protein